MLWHAPIGEVPEHRLAASPRGHETYVGRGARDRALDGLLVAVPLRGDHDDRPRIDCLGREVSTVDELGAPPEDLREVAQHVRHRRAAHHDEVRGRHDRLDVHLHRALALTRDGDDDHAVGHVAELLGRAEQQEPRLAVDNRGLRFSDDRRLRARAADPAVDRTGRGDDRPRALLA